MLFMEDVLVAGRLEEPFGVAQGRRVLNLRLRRGVDGRGELAVAVPPASFAGLNGWRPVCRAGGRLVVAAGKVPGLVDDSGSTGLPSVGLLVLPGEPLCSMPLSADEALVMTDGGPATVGAALNEVSVRECGYEYPAVTLRAVQVSVAAQAVGARTLSKVFASEGRLSASDSAGLVADLEGAYREAVAKASSAGCMVQPALVRYRLTGLRGEVLFESPSVLLGTDIGWQSADTVETSISGGEAAAYELQLKCWRIEALLPAESMQEVAAVEVFVSPQFHPYRSGGRGMAVLVRDTEGYKVRVGLPGAFTASGRGAEWRVRKAIARMDSIEERAGRVAAPFGGTARAVTLFYAPEGDVAVASRSFEASCRAAVPRADFAEALLSAPHRFAAACVAGDGRTVAWGAPRALRYAGYPPALFAVSTTSASWRATVVVRFDGRRGVVRTVECDSGCPTALGPVLSYPSPDARSMTVLIWSEGVTRRFDCELTPDDSGRRAVYVADDLKPVGLTAVSAAALVDTEDASESFPDIIAIATAEEPLRPIGIVRHGAGEVMGLEGVPGAEQAWDRGRSRYYAACRGGVLSLAVSGAGGSLSVRTVYNRGVSGPGCMAAGGGEVYVLAEDAGGAVPLAVSCRGAVRVLAPAADYSALVYDRRLGEVWAVKNGGGADVFTSGGMYRRICPAYTAVVSVSGEYYGLHDGGVDRISLPGNAEGVTVEYTDSFSPARRGVFSLHSVRADVAGGGLTGSITLSAADGNGNAVRPILIRELSGALKSPVELRTVCAPARTVAVSICGMADSSTVIRSFLFRMSWMRH